MSKLLFLFNILFISLCLEASNYGPWPMQYFADGERFSCHEESPCIVPRLDDMEEMVKDFKELGSTRLERLQGLSTKASEKVQEVLGLSQNLQLERGENHLSRVFLAFGSELSTELENQRLERARLFVSESSPVLELVEGLQGLLIDFNQQIENQPDENLREGLKLLKKEKYKEFVMSPKFLETMNLLKLVKNEYFSELEGQEGLVLGKLLDKKVSLMEEFPKRDCNKKMRQYIEDMIGTIQVSNSLRASNEFDPVKDFKLLKFLLNGKRNKSLRLRCRDFKRFGRIKATYDAKDHELTIKFKVQMDSQGVNQLKGPSRQSILNTFKGQY